MQQSTAGDPRAARRRPVPICRSAAAHSERHGAQLAVRARHAGGLYGIDTEHNTTGRCVNNEFVKERHAAMVEVLPFTYVLAPFRFSSPSPSPPAVTRSAYLET